ncbi:MAG: hypothetical protein MI919_05765 [Holophagales bacterium]|nr:hypothetical protein [Holophagales bacterium]
MKKENRVGFLALLGGTFVITAAVGALAVTVYSGSTAPALPAADDTGAHASWVSGAETVAEQVAEADVVVRVQAVDRAAPRHLWSPRPAGVERIAGRSTFAFSDTEVEVLEVYRGDVGPGDRLWVMQTGGDLPLRGGGTSRLEIAEDPLYELGSEMVLFLIDISGDPVHAPSRQLFRTVNPNGRYHLEGGLASRLTLGDTARMPAETELTALEAEIRAAAAARAALER